MKGKKKGVSLVEKLLNNREMKFASDYFEKKQFRVIRIDDCGNRIQVLAKNLSTRNNETFEIKGGELRILIHQKNNKYHPWKWKVVARQVSTRSYLQAMREAVNGSRQ